MLNNFLIIRAVSITIDFWPIKKSIEIDCAFSGYTPIGVLGYDISSISDNLARKSVSFDIYKMGIFLLIAMIGLPLLVSQLRFRHRHILTMTFIIQKQKRILN